MAGGLIVIPLWFLLVCAVTAVIFYLCELTRIEWIENISLPIVLVLVYVVSPVFLFKFVRHRFGDITADEIKKNTKRSIMNTKKKMLHYEEDIMK